MLVLSRCLKEDILRAFPSKVDQAKIQRMVEEGLSVEKISEIVKVKPSNLAKYIKSFGWEVLGQEVDPDDEEKDDEKDDE